MADEQLTFSYQARSKSGKLVEGKVKASNPEVVAAELTSRGFIPIDVKEVATGGLNTEISFGSKRVKPRDVALLARQFSVMIDAGLPLMKALTVLQKQAKNPTLASALLRMRSDIESGASLADAMAEHPTVFTDLVVNMVRAGEAGGFLDQSMRQIATNLESEVKLRSKIKSAMTYPVMVFIMAILMGAGMLLFIVPIFQEMFESLGGDLPLPTQILVIASDFLKIAIIPIIAGIVAFGVWWRKNKQKMWVRNIKEPFMLKMPVFGTLVQKIALARFTRNLSTLLTSGVPVLKALDIVSDTTGNVVISRALEQVKASVATGNSINEPLKEHPVFPPMVVEMIAVGEDTGAIDRMLEKIAESYDDDVEATTEALTSLIEPLMIVFLGSFVGAIIISLYLPIFSVFDLIQ